MAQDFPSTRRERRIAARKVTILHAAARLFAEKGFHRTTTRDIADAADVSEGTIYNYFENKDELLMAIMQHLAEEEGLEASFSQEMSADVREFLRHVLRERREAIDQSGYMVQSVLSEILVSPELRQRYYQELVLPGLTALEAHLQARNENGQVQIDHPALVARLVIGLLQGLFLLEVLGDPELKDRWDELTEVIVSTLFEGVGP